MEEAFGREEKKLRVIGHLLWYLKIKLPIETAELWL